MTIHLWKLDRLADMLAWASVLMVSLYSPFLWAWRGTLRQRLRVLPPVRYYGPLMQLSKIINVSIIVHALEQMQTNL